MLIRLIYASESAEALSPTIAESIVQQARTANASRNITGMLVFGWQRFLQVLEGERNAVSEVICRIANGPRHRRVVLLEAQPASERGANGRPPGQSSGRPRLTTIRVNTRTEAG